MSSQSASPSTSPSNRPSSLDTRHIGHRLAPFSAEVEKGRLRLFAKATGQSDPVYTDEAAARQAGHPALPVPPTFLFCLEMDAPDPHALRELLGMDITKVLHGEQRFRYHAMAYAGDTLRFEQHIADIYQKKGGLLQFVVRETLVRNQRDELVAELTSTTLVRYG